MKKKLLIFHPVIAPYRIDFFNKLSEKFETRVCMFWRNLKDQMFDYSKIEAQLNFTPMYLVKEEMGLMKWIISIWKQLSKSKPDIVFGAEFGIATFVIILHRFLTRGKYKIVIQCDDSYHMVTQNSHFTKRHAMAVKYLLPYIDEIINPEPRVSEWYHKNYGKGIYFPIICNDDIARKRQESSLTISESYVSKFRLEGKKILLFVGRLVSFKNIDFAVNAFIKANIENSVFVIVGNGELQDPLRKLTSKYDNVIMVGRYEREALYAWYNVAQVFTLPSYLEPFGAVTNEALVAGCKSLISKNAGSNCLIKDGENGFTIDPHDVNDYVEKFRKLMNEVRGISIPLKVKPNMMTTTFSEHIDRLVAELEKL